MLKKGSKAVEKAIRKANQKGQAALIPFIEGADPNLSLTRDLLWTLAEAGADVIELGFPFSDPLADGPTIQEAAQRALKNNPSLEEFLLLVAELREEGFSVPLVLMGYFNPFYKFGLEKFAREASRAGIDGAIIPDLPLEEASPWLKWARKFRLAHIMLVAPTTPEKRLAQIARASSGFLYYVSVTGITGVRDSLPKNLALKLDLAQELSPIPVAVGFGISTPKQVKSLAPYTDAIVVGSALVKIIAQHLSTPKKLLKEVKNFVKDLKSATLREV